MKTPNHNACEKGGFSQFYIAYNGLRIGDGGAFEKRQPKICTNAQ